MNFTTRILSAVLGLFPLRYSPYQFALFRILFGLYLTWHFVLLIPYAGELFSGDGMIPEASWLPTAAFFPNLLAWFPSPEFATGFVMGLAALAIVFTLGVARTWVAFLLWFGWATLFNRNVFINNPGLPMVGWLLLACALVPRGEPLRFGAKDEDWQMPPLIFWGAWLITGIGYTVSGLHKMGSPSWTDGTALRILLDNPLARDTALREFLQSAPDWVFTVKTYFSLGLEILFLPLVLTKWTRPVAWLAIVGMHMGILSVISFADLTLGVLMMHFFTFDARWIPAKSASARPILFFDGVCGLCNASVDFVMKEDALKRFRFSPLQSGSAQETLGPQYVTDLKSLVLKVDDRIFTRSDAVLKIASLLGGMWRLAGIAYLIPRAARDRVYDFVAAHRYAWFGKKDTCRMPTAEERARFLL